MRDRLELLLRHPDLEEFVQHQEFARRLHELDGRFRARAHPTHRFKYAGGWWNQLVPTSAGIEMVRDCREHHGFELELS